MHLHHVCVVLFVALVSPLKIILCTVATRKREYLEQGRSSLVAMALREDLIVFWFWLVSTHQPLVDIRITSHARLRPIMHF